MYTNIIGIENRIIESMSTSVGTISTKLTSKTIYIMIISRTDLLVTGWATQGERVGITIAFLLREEKFILDQGSKYGIGFNPIGTSWWWPWIGQTLHQS